MTVRHLNSAFMRTVKMSKTLQRMFKGRKPCLLSNSKLVYFSLGESDLQVGGEVLSGCEGVLPHHQVGNVVDGEAEFR